MQPDPVRFCLGLVVSEDDRDSILPVRSSCSASGGWMSLPARLAIARGTTEPKTE
jgi:hypothetical protein